MNRLRRTASLLTGAVLAASTPLPSSSADFDALRGSVLLVSVNGGAIIRSGFAIAGDGRALTAAHAVANAESIAVEPLGGGERMPARVIHSSGRSDIALLAVDGLRAAPLTLAKDGFEPGRLVYSAGAWGARDAGAMRTAEGAVGLHGEVAAAEGLPAVPLILHNAMIPAEGYGGPLLNECGEVAGVNRGDPGLRPRQLRRGGRPAAVVHASAVAAVTGFLLPAGVAPAQAERPCESAKSVAAARAEAAEGAAARAAADAEDARARAVRAGAEAEAKNAELLSKRRELAQAEARAAELEERRTEAVRAGDEQADALQAELAEAREAREAAQDSAASLEDALETERAGREADAQAGDARMRAGLGSALAVAALAAILILLAHRRRSRQLNEARRRAAEAERDADVARQDAERLQREAPDCLLTGRAGDGGEVTIKVPGGMLLGDAAVIGRGNQAAFVLLDETLSRRHARLTLDDDGDLFIEDLNTTNGTRLNGRRAPPGEPVRLSDADELELGGVKLRVSWDG